MPASSAVPIAPFPPALPDAVLLRPDDERRALDAHALVSITDARGDIVYANAQFCTTSGYEPQELIGRNHRIVRSGRHPPELYTGLWRTILRGEVWQGELCNRRKDGSLYWVATTILPMSGDGGERHYLSVRTDITQAKLVQFALRRKVRQQRVLAALSRRLMGCDHAALQALAPRILRVGSRLLGAGAARWLGPAGPGAAEPVVAVWPEQGTVPGGPDAGSPALPGLLELPIAAAAAAPAGRLQWWPAPGHEPWSNADLGFAHTLAGIVAGAWSRAEAECARRAADQALTGMLEAYTGVVVIVGAGGVYEFANEAFARLYGRRVDQVVGRGLDEVLGRDEAAATRLRQQAVLAGGRPMVFEATLPSSPAAARHFTIVHFATGGSDGLPLRFFQIGIDISERKRMEQSLEHLMTRAQAQSRLQVLIAAIATELGAVSAATLDVMIQALLRDIGEYFAVDRADLFLLDADGRSISNTHEWCAAGVPSKRESLQAMPVDSAPWFRLQLLERALPVRIDDVDALPAAATAEQQRLRGLGVKAALAVPMGADGQVLGFIGFEAVHRPREWPEGAERALGLLAQIVANAVHRVRTERQLRALKEQAEAASAAKSDFLASMSHELRTPMNAVLGFGQLLELALAGRPAEQGFVQEILKGGRHLLALIDDILDLARVESGRVDLSNEPIVLDEVVAECLRLMQPLADRRRIRLHAQTAGLRVQADRVRLKQVLVNLVSNAIKYNVEAGAVDIAAAAADGGRVRIEVRDTGPGIAPERQHELFQPFSRLGAEAGPVEGTGIGLMLVRRLVELMDGTVGVHSEPGRGSRFWFLLPQVGRGGDDDGGRREPRPAAPPALPDAAPGVRRMLYIDDNPQNLRLMQSILERWPCVHLLTASHPPLALELAEAHRPDLVLLDIQMAPLDGYEVLRRLRSHPELARVPVVAVTAGALPRDLARACAAGFDDCVTKPFDVQALLGVLARHLRTPSAP